MCGIMGVLRKDQSPLELSEADLLAMRDTMLLRGPNAAGLKQIRPHVVFSHRRLSIRDLESGQQPWTSEDGRYTLTYNGELYNCAELDRLTKAHFSASLRTHCDTELLMRTWQVFGAETPRYLRGMFAFGVYDNVLHELTIVRDRFGVKPLYYGQAGQDFVFASNVRAIQRHPQFRSRPDRKAIAHYLLTLRTSFDHQTMLSGIQQLPPGCLLTLRNGQQEISRYWNYPTQAVEQDFSATHELLAEKFADSVSCRMVSDVPVGMMLSGGVDSSLLGSYVREQLGPDFVAECGVGDANKSSEDEIFAREAAEEFQCRFRVVSTSGQDYRTYWRELIRETGQPLATPSDVIIYRLAQSLKQQVGVVLGGEGADELLCGYEAIHGAAWEFDKFNPSSMRSEEQLLDRYFQLGALIPVAAQKLLWREQGDDEAAIRHVYAALMSSGAEGSGSGLLSVTKLLHQVNLESLLSRLDQATMAASLEARVPYTDHLLVEAIWPTPFSHRIDRVSEGSLATKRVLRSLARQRLPASLAERKKASFPTSVPQWLRTNWRDWAAETILASPFLEEMFHQQPLMELAEHPEQAGMWLWPLLNLALWGEQL